MTEKIEDGGPAFPVSTGDPRNAYQDGAGTAQFPGMSMRDAFAMAAVQGFLAGSMADGSTVTKEGIESAAAASYLVADEMLKARSTT